MLWLDLLRPARNRPMNVACDICTSAHSNTYLPPTKTTCAITYVWSLGRPISNPSDASVLAMSLLSPSCAHRHSFYSTMSAVHVMLPPKRKKVGIRRYALAASHVINSSIPATRKISEMLKFFSAIPHLQLA